MQGVQELILVHAMRCSRSDADTCVIKFTSRLAPEGAGYGDEYGIIDLNARISGARKKRKIF